MTRVAVIGILPNPIHADNKGLVLNRARLQQSNPMGYSLFRPVRNHDKKFGLVCRRTVAEQFREAQVVANERRNAAFTAAEGHWVLTSHIMLRFATRGKGPHFGIKRQKLPIRGKYQGLVACLAI